MTRTHSTIFAATTALWFAVPANERLAAEPVAPPAGFVQIVIPAHSDAIVSIPFAPGDASLETVLAAQLTASTNLAAADRVLLWDAANARYRAAAKLLLPSSPGSGIGSDSVWTEISVSPSGAETILGPVGNDFRIEPGAGFVLCNRQDREQTVRIAGQVVMNSLRSVPIPAGASLVGLPYTTARPAGKSSLNESGSVLTTNAFRMGEGAWIKSDKDGTWQEPRPYPNPFSLSNAPVRIVDLVCDADKATLDIEVTDPTVQSLDVLTLDLAASSVVTDWACGWQLAAANVKTAGQTELAWSDSLSASASSFKGVRLYLVLRADSAADLNGDGTPDPVTSFLRPSGPLASASTPSETATLSAGTVAVAADILNTSIPALPVAPALAPVARTMGFVFVDILKGDNRFEGRSSVVAGGDGPKKTIGAGVSVAATGGTVVVLEGNYGEDVDVSGKPVRIRIQGKVNLKGKRQEAR